MKLPQAVTDSGRESIEFEQSKEYRKKPTFCRAFLEVMREEGKTGSPGPRMLVVGVCCRIRHPESENGAQLQSLAQ